MSIARFLVSVSLLTALMVVSIGSPLRAQQPSRIYVSPSSPTTTDAVEITVGAVCVAFIQAPQLAQQTIRIDGVPFNCGLGPPTLATQTFLIGTLPTGVYTLDVYVSNQLSSVQQFSVGPQNAEALPDDVNLDVFLNQFRFRVEASWHDPRAGAGGGSGYGRQLTDESAYFWFFDRTSAEVTVRVIDGRFVNGHFWVFVASTTDLGLDLTVIDTGEGHLACAPLGPATCPSRTYHALSGKNQNFLDVEAF
jgi:hypothetical protein